MRSEFQFINDIKERFSPLLIGDDCAVLPKDEISDLLITADMLIQNVDFRLEWAKPADIGHKSLAVSLSDIAAMGGTPTYGLVSLGVPEDLWGGEFLDEFYNGWRALAAKFGVELAGGDVSSSRSGLVIDSILLGVVPKGRACLRSGAKVGDHIYVSGTIGAAAAALRLLEAGFTDDSSELVQRQLRPTPQVDLAKQLNDLGLVTAMIDLSDGISSDLSHLCKSSHVGALIEANSLPIDPNIYDVISGPAESLNVALNGGEDFELLFTSTSELPDSITDRYSVTRVGTITVSEKTEILENGKIRDLPQLGFRHF